MKKIFETLIESFSEHNVGITENFLGEQLAIQLKENLILLNVGKVLKSAGTGNEESVHQDTLVRNDKIYWLDKSHNDPYENEFFILMDVFIRYLNETCYTGITGYEFHYAWYEKGNFYKKHFDRFRNDDSRQFSMITYLNSDWNDGDGGELCIHHTDRVQLIAPTNGKSVFFNSSELEHEVLITNVPRLSITGWLKR